MAAQIKKGVCGYGSGWTPDAFTVKAFFDTINTSLFTTTLVDDTTVFINIDNTMVLKYYFGTNNSNHSIKLSINGGEDISIGDCSTWYKDKTFIVVVSDRYLDIYYYESGPKIDWFIYEKIGNDTYYGYRYEGNEYYANLSLSDVTLFSLNTGIQYKHGQRLNYTKSNPGYLDYANDCLFNTNLSSENIECEEILACSKLLSPRIVVTFNEKNYYAVSPNSLIEIETT